MSSRIRSFVSRVAASVAVGGLAVVAGANLIEGGLIIVAPVQVQGGNPICGYVTGTTPDTCVEGIGPNGPLSAPPPPPGSPPPDGVVPVHDDPMYYAFATTESMAICVVTIHAYNPIHSALATVLVY